MTISLSEGRSVSWSVVFDDDVLALFQQHRLRVILWRGLATERTGLAGVFESVARDAAAGHEAELDGASA